MKTELTPFMLITFDLVFLFKNMSTFGAYLKPPFWNNISGRI